MSTSKSFPDSLSGTHLVVATFNGSQFPVQGPNDFVTKWTNTVTHGDNLPGWRDLLRTGGNATTSLTGNKVKAHLTNGNARFTQAANYFETLTGTQLVNMSVPTQDPSEMDYAKAEAAALGKFHQKMRQVRTTFEGGVFLGELGQTLQMIRNPARGLRKLVDDWRDIAQAIRNQRIRGSLAYLKRLKVAEHLADAWLEVQYGWRPALADIRDASKALEKYTNGRPLHLKRIRAKGEVSGVSSDTSSTRAVGVCRWKTRDRLVGTSTVVYRGAMRVAARDPRVMDPALIGFDLSSFVPTVWELIPYSFLIDYFSNVGDIITGWSNLGTELSWCNRTVRRVYKRESWAEKDPAWAINPAPWLPAKSVFEKQHVLRTKITDISMPAFELEIPRLGSLKWLNIAALVVARNEDRKWFYD